MSEDALWEDGGVSIFRPSYSATWLNCAGSLKPSRYAKDTAGIDAATGTVFHDLMAYWQWHNRRPVERLGTVVRIYSEDNLQHFDITVDDQMFVAGDQCLEYVKDIVGDRYTEQRVDISGITPIPGQSGTADLAVCSNEVLDIIDWKYGTGVKVFAKDNSQLLCYGYGFFCEWDWVYNFQRIRLHIAQPRLNHFECWEITRQELLDWAIWAKARAVAAWKDKAERHPGPKQCQWCKIRTNCSAMEVARQAMVDSRLDDLDEPMDESQFVTAGTALIFPEQRQPLSPAELSTWQLSRIYQFRALMEKWLKDIGNELILRINQGEKVEGWKIVTGRTHRKYVDEGEVSTVMAELGMAEEEIYARKVISPNQLKKILPHYGYRGKAADTLISKYVYFPQGKPTIVPDGDNRLAIPAVVDHFDDIEEDEDSDI